MKHIGFWFLFLSFISVFSCTTKQDVFQVPENASFLVPLGSTAFPVFSTVLSIDGRPCDWGVKTDGFGNSWAAIAVPEFTGSRELVMRYTITRKDAVSYPAAAKRGTDWLQPNRYIDWRNAAILSAVKELHLEGLEDSEAALRIGRYVQSHLAFLTGNSTHPASIPASETLASGKGVCINFSRLFISLCRASGIPARSVSGIVRNHDNTTEYDFHHEWMEYLDEQGYWHPIDLTYSKGNVLNDPRYAGFVYGAEDHSWFAAQDNKTLKSGLPIQLENGDIVLFHYHPLFPGARFGFRLIESQDMKYYIIEKTMVISVKDECARIRSFR